MGVMVSKVKAGAAVSPALEFAKRASLSRFGATTNRVIEELIRKEKLRQSLVLKILLLGDTDISGISGSGKSTVMKQMRILHLQGFSEGEMFFQRSRVFSNIISGMQDLVSAMTSLGIAFEHSERTADAALVSSKEPDKVELLDEETATAVENLWKDSGVKECFERRSQSQLPIQDTAQYFFDNLDRIRREDYLPTQDDLLHVRHQTTGIVEITFEAKGAFFTAIDVGGQRSERRKWLHCFDNVTALLYLTAISEYDQFVIEDPSVNRLRESLELFNVITSSMFFKRSSIILFLNKKDLFKEKITRVPLQVVFPEYDGPQAYKEAVQYITTKFRRRMGKAQELYSHRTCGTDTHAISVTLEASYDVILRNNMACAGMT